MTLPPKCKSSHRCYINSEHDCVPEKLHLQKEASATCFHTPALHGDYLPLNVVSLHKGLIVLRKKCLFCCHWVGCSLSVSEVSLGTVFFKPSLSLLVYFSLFQKFLKRTLKSLIIIVGVSIPVFVLHLLA